MKGEPARVQSEGVTTALYFRGAEAGMAQPYGEEIGKIMSYFTGVFGLPPYANLTVVETEDGAPNGYAAPGMIFLAPRGIGKQVNSKLLANQISRQWWEETGLAGHAQSSVAHQRRRGLLRTAVDRARQRRRRPWRRSCAT